MDKLEEIEIKRGLKQKYGDLVDRRIFCLGHSRVLNNPFYQKIRSQPGTLIDEGCGPGDDIRQFLKDGFRPIGVDLNEKSFELGFEWYKDADKIRPLLRKGDVTRLDRKHFSNASFKYSYSGSLIHGLKTVDNVKAYLSEVSRVLVPGGILFGSTVGRPEGQEPKNTGDHRLLMLTPSELSSLIEKQGRMKIIGLEFSPIKPTDLSGYDFLKVDDPPGRVRVCFLARKR